MKIAIKLKGILLGTVLLSTLSLTSTARAGVFASVAIDGDFSDWSAIPAVFTDANEGFSKDVNQIFLANDSDFLYLRVTFNQATNPNDGSGFYLGFDNDSDAGTGFNVYGLNIVGTEGAYQNDFPFEQSSGVFNTGAANSGAAVLISPYSTSTNSQEFSFSRSALIDSGNGQLLFPNSSFNLAVYFNDANSDFAGVASYTFAPVPEPSAAGLLVLGALPLLVRRRRVG